MWRFLSNYVIIIMTSFRPNSIKNDLIQYIHSFKPPRSLLKIENSGHKRNQLKLWNDHIEVSKDRTIIANLNYLVV